MKLFNSLFSTKNCSGVFQNEGQIFEGEDKGVTYFESSNGKFLSINIYANMEDDPYEWTVSDRLGSFNAVIMNR